MRDTTFPTVTVWIGRLSIALFVCMAAILPAGAQNSTFSISGRVTGADGAAVAGASVRGSTSAGIVRESTTDADGRYVLALTVDIGGAIELRVERIGYFPLVVEFTVGADDAPMTRDVRLTPRAVALDAIEVLVSRPAQRAPQAATPGGNEESWSSWTLDAYPLLPGDLADIAGHKPGVSLRRGGEDGVPAVSIAGQHPSQTGITLDGSSFGAVSLPAEALRSTAVVTSTYDPSRGQFSGGQIAATTRSGTNTFGGAFRARGSHPALQAAGGRGAEDASHSVLEVGGGAGGALIRDRFFWYFAAQGSRRRTPSVSLDGARAATLRALGISPDSVGRFRSLSEELGLGAAASGDRVADRGAALLRVDFHASDKHTLTLRADARDARADGVGRSVFGLATAGATARTSAGGGMVQLASYVGDRFRNELRVYRSREDRMVDLARAAPTGYVQVVSDLGAGERGAATLRLGDAGFLPADSRSAVTEIADEMLVRVRGDDHRLKLGLQFTRASTRESGVPNRLGTFLFRSLADFEAGEAAAFTRALDASPRLAETEYGALYAAHFWRATRRLWVIQGARVEGWRYPGAPSLAPAAARFGSPSSRIPSSLSVSPRIGFTYENREARVEAHGGVGQFRGTLPPSALAAALAQTGGMDGVRQLLCVGPATPTPVWSDYLADPASIPSTCREGGAGFVDRAPAVTAFSRDFRVPRTWRASLGVSKDFPQWRFGQVSVYFDAAYIRGLDQPIARDANRATSPGFALAEESGRAVFAPAWGIDPATGAFDPSSTRDDPGFGIVTSVGSTGRSSVAQLTIGGSLLTPRLDIVSAYYTFTRTRDGVAGVPAPGAFASPVAAGDPDRVLRAPSDFEQRHTFQLHAVHPVNRWLEIGVLGQLASGAPYTPLVDVDINGDGLANDAAFVFQPGQGDAETAAAMADLLARAPAGTRRCLERQVGRIAARNSCRAPWTTSLDLQANLRGPRGSGLNRLAVTVAATNVLAGIDQLFHGRSPRGWGGTAYLDPTLLHVRGFDGDRRAFHYDVNPGFGARSGARDPYRPGFALTINGRVTVGSDPARQPFRALVNSIRARGRPATEVRRALSARIPNLPLQVLSVNDSLELGLSAEQRRRLEQAGDSVTRLLSPLTDTLATAISTMETSTEPERVREASAVVGRLVAAAQVALDASLEVVRAVLSPEQWRALPTEIREPTRQLIPERTAGQGGGSELW